MKVDNEMTVNEKPEYAIFTVCNLAYLPKAIALSESVWRFNKLKLNIYLIDRKVDVDFSAIKANILWIEDLGIPNLYELAFKYDIIELSTSLKPHLTLKLLDKFKKVVFLDPDTYSYSSVAPILSDLEDHSIVLTPHYTTPLSIHSHPGWGDDIGMMRFGSFNLGFYAVKDSPQGLNFLRWWSDRCLKLNFMETQFGLSTDQKWVSIAPCFFEDLYVSFNLGYNAAPWNIFERCIEKNHEGGYIVNDTYPLVFFHFSNFDENDLDYSKERSLLKKEVKCPALLELSTIYKQALSAKSTGTALTKYGFDYLSSGEYISSILRRAYACVAEELPPNHDPFDSSGVVGDFARKNFLFGRGPAAYAPSGFQELAKNKYKMRFIYFAMRTILRVVGPNRFYNFSRLLVYLSSYRQNRGLWKY